LPPSTQRRGKLADTEIMFKRAIDIVEKSGPPGQLDLALYLGNLAVLYRKQQRYTEAERLARRALAIDESYFGAEHPNVAAQANDLALLLRETNRFAEAEILMRRALAIEEKLLGDEHPTVAIRLSNLGDLLRITNRSEEAESLLRRALAIDEKALGPEHPRVAIDMGILALLLQANDRFAEASHYFVARWLSTRTSRKLSTVRRYLASISVSHTLKGHTFDRKHPSIKTILRGAARGAPLPRRVRPLLSNVPPSLLARTDDVIE
jgi:tetratricopeptide (TPR) repeat protein